MKQLLNPQTVTFAVELAKDIWQLLHDAKHPDHASRVVENIKDQLSQHIQEAQSTSPVDQAAPCQPASVREAKKKKC